MDIAKELFESVQKWYEYRQGQDIGAFYIGAEVPIPPGTASRLCIGTEVV